ncbi:MAG: 5'/3'-nucleotidase SurE, partial [Trichodesmium sp. St16_bin2-tuft]|nr:5'/3'-nucleotidase SurE [Trichodesmium sp. St16_bin2-tuft]
YTGKYDERDRAPGTDVDVCFSGNIAITKIQLF